MTSHEEIVEPDGVVIGTVERTTHHDDGYSSYSEWRGLDTLGGLVATTLSDSSRRGPSHEEARAFVVSELRRRYRDAKNTTIPSRG